MAEQIVFYSSPMSRGRMVQWMLEECGAPYETRLIDLSKGQQKDAAFLAINPMGKLPTIVHRGITVTETGAIIAYLADAFPAAKLAPPIGDPMRGAYLRWLFFGAASVDPCLIDRMLQRPPAENAGAVGYGRAEVLMDTLEKALVPGPYLLGAQFSAADVYVGSQIGFGLMTKALEPRASYTAYLERLTSRPAYQRAVKICEEQAERLKAA